MSTTSQYRTRCPSCKTNVDVALSDDSIGKLLTCDSCAYQWLALYELRGQMRGFVSEGYP